MKILLTVANVYIGTRLLPRLVEEGHEFYAMVRSELKFPRNSNLNFMSVKLISLAYWLSIAKG